MGELNNHANIGAGNYMHHGIMGMDYYNGVGMANGRFMITKSIGKGSFGEIFQGLDTATNKEVAIKMVSIIIRIHSSASIYIQIELDLEPCYISSLF